MGELKNMFYVKVKRKQIFQLERSEYIETREGQSYERLKRSFGKFYLILNQEPKSKNSISNEEKRIFRQTVLDFLREHKRRAFRGDIILEIDFQTTQDNPPALQTLTKNYPDLLHKPMPEIDNYKEILFRDDNQIKTLIATYHLNQLGNSEPRIRIKAYRYSHFLNDIELVDRIRSDRFNNDDSFGYRYKRFEDIDDHQKKSYEHGYFYELIELEEDKDWITQLSGENFYELQRRHLQRHIQEQYLQQRNISIDDLITLHQSSFERNKKYKDDSSFQKSWNLSTNLISVSTNLIELGGVPRRKGDTKSFKLNLKQKLNDFKAKHTILFPLLQPLSLTIFYTSPINNILDLDNLAKYIIPLLTDIFKPPSTLNYDSKYLSDLLRIEISTYQKFPENGIANYQLIHKPRTDDTPDVTIQSKK